MVLEDQTSTEITPISEIRAHKALRLEDFNQQYPDWEWSERRKQDRLMYDEQGQAWVPMFNPKYGTEFAYDDPEFTAAAEEFLAADARRAREEIAAGHFTLFADLDADEDFWNE